MAKQIMNFVKNLQNKFKGFVDLFDYTVWLYKQWRLPRSIGTSFKVKRGNYIIHYEVSAHAPNGKYPKEVIEEVFREKIK